MSVLMGVVGSFVAIIAFSVLLETPGKYLWQTGVVGAIGGGVYLLCTHRGVDVVPASFFSALAIAFMAHLFARIFKAPVTVFLIAGILPTVPGAGMYRIAYSIVANDRAGCALLSAADTGDCGDDCTGNFYCGCHFPGSHPLVKAE